MPGRHRAAHAAPPRGRRLAALAAGAILAASAATIVSWALPTRTPTPAPVYTSAVAGLVTPVPAVSSLPVYTPTIPVVTVPIATTAPPKAAAPKPPPTTTPPTSSAEPTDDTVATGIPEFPPDPDPDTIPGVCPVPAP